MYQTWEMFKRILPRGGLDSTLARIGDCTPLNPYHFKRSPDGNHHADGCGFIPICG